MPTASPHALLRKLEWRVKDAADSILGGEYRSAFRGQGRGDQLTEVVVYKVGRLGTFERRDLDLRPGSYTVVGSRRGYRDVRRQLVIQPGVAPEPVAIRCQERI